MTTKEAAGALGTSLRNLHHHCKRMGVGRHGNSYLLTEEHVEQIRQYMATHKPGRPPQKRDGEAVE